MKHDDDDDEKKLDDDQLEDAPYELDDLNEESFAEEDEEEDEGYLDEMFAERDAEIDGMVDDFMNDRASISLCYMHLYFSTARQEPLLEDDSLRAELHQEMNRICESLRCKPLAIGGWHDHVHVVINLSPELSVDGFVNRLKDESAAWLRCNSPELGATIWQESYGGCTVDGPGVGDLREYLDEEPSRHAIESYEDEFRRLCAENEIEIEEPDCWE